MVRIRNLLELGEIFIKFFRRLHFHEGKKLFEIYKKLQILEMLINNSIRDVMLPALMFGMPSIQFFASYVCIKMHGTMALPNLAFFIIIYLDTVVLTNTVITPAASIFTGSGKLLEKWITSSKAMKRKYLRKFRGACRPLRVKFGSNFVDKKTPLVMQDMCMRQTMSSLLITQ
jgi:hypothetical protein